MAGAELPWCAAHDVGVIAYSPMQSGLLTDGFSAARLAALPPDDYRHRGSEFTPPRVRPQSRAPRRARPVARRHGCSIGEIAIAWVLAWPAVTGAIVGARSAAQVDGWIGAAEVPLSPADLDEIAVLIERTGAGEGPRRP